MGAASPGKYKVRVHTITDYHVEANAVGADDLKGSLLRIHEELGMVGLVEHLRALTRGDGDAIVGSHGLEVESEQ